MTMQTPSPKTESAVVASPLAELAERVENLTGQDREVDAQVRHAVDGVPPPSCPVWWLTEDELPPYTHSVDAVLFLVSEKLPGWWVQHLGQCRGGWGCRIERQGLSIPQSMRLIVGKTPAIALLSATLRALAAKGGA